MTKLFFGKGTERPVYRAIDVREFLAVDRKHHYQATFSMAETAESWVAAAGHLPRSIADLVGHPDLCSAHFEYPTYVWGRGLSMTDVMAFTPKTVIAVEGKVREELGKRVRDWLVERGEGTPSHANRLKAIGRYADAFGLSRKSLYTVRYQLLYRTLSAALAAKDCGFSTAWMIVQAFVPRNDPHHRMNVADFNQLIALAGSAPVIEGVCVNLALTEESPSNIRTD